MRNLVIEAILRYYEAYPYLEAWTGIAESRLNHLSNYDLLDHLEECIITIQEYFHEEKK